MDGNHERLLTLSKNGDVYTSIRISLTLGCYMNFHIFPMDIQTCPIELESFGYSMDILRIVQILVPCLMHLFKCKTRQWKIVEFLHLFKRFNWQEKGALQLNPYIVLPQFEIKGFKLKDCTKNYSSGHMLHNLQQNFLKKIVMKNLSNS